MDCTRTEDLLSAYLDGDLPERERERVTEHIRQCHRCAGEERALRETISLLRNLPAESAPPGLIEGVRTRIGGERASAPLWKRLFLPAHIKIPLEAAAVALIFLFVYGIQKEIPATKPLPSDPASVERGESAGRAEQKERTDTPGDRRKADTVRTRPVDVAEGRSGTAGSAREPREESSPVKEPETAPLPRREKSSRLADSELPAVPATRVSTGGRSIEPASPRESRADEAPTRPIFAAPPSRLMKPIPYGREVILEVAPDNRAGMEERIAVLATRLGGTVNREGAQPAGAGAEETPALSETVRLTLPGGSADAFLEELGRLGSIPAVGTVGRLGIPAGPTIDTVAYTVRIRVR